MLATTHCAALSCGWRRVSIGPTAVRARTELSLCLEACWGAGRLEIRAALAASANAIIVTGTCFLPLANLGGFERLRWVHVSREGHDRRCLGGVDSFRTPQHNPADGAVWPTEPREEASLRHPKTGRSAAAWKSGARLQDQAWHQAGEADLPESRTVAKGKGGARLLPPAGCTERLVGVGIDCGRVQYAGWPCRPCCRRSVSARTASGHPPLESVRPAEPPRSALPVPWDARCSGRCLLGPRPPSGESSLLRT